MPAAIARLPAQIARIDLARLGDRTLRGLLLTTLAVSALIFSLHSV